jgi:hypothetical protein
VLALHGHVEEPFLGYLRWIVVMLGVFKIDQVSPLEPEDPDPVELRFVTGVIIFFHAGIDTSPAANTAGKLKTVAPEGVGDCPLRADLKFFPELLVVSFFQFSDGVFLFFRGHFVKMLLKKILDLFLRTGGK